MHHSAFFRIFPPPKFMQMKHAGLDISDDAIRCIEFSLPGASHRISKYDSVSLPPGLIKGGDIKDEKQLASILREFDMKNDLSYVKVSIPEEKAYLFQTDVPSRDTRSITQNVESKLEENVPLQAADAIFYFDILPASMTGSSTRVSVSVVPLTYVERYISLLEDAGITPIAFEVVPKSIARAVVPEGSDDTVTIVHLTAQKAGIYIVTGGVVCFTSTIERGEGDGADPYSASFGARLSKEIGRVHSYWDSHGRLHAGVSRAFVLGHDAEQYVRLFRTCDFDRQITFEVADVWRNIFDVNEYIPPITQTDSLDFAVAAGLAMH